MKGRVATMLLFAARIVISGALVWMALQTSSIAVACLPFLCIMAGSVGILALLQFHPHPLTPIYLLFASSHLLSFVSFMTLTLFASSDLGDYFFALYSIENVMFVVTAVFLGSAFPGSRKRKVNSRQQAWPR